MNTNDHDPAFGHEAHVPRRLGDLDLMDAEARRELLGAYIDGELPADEALHVSVWLDDNPGALRVVEHLRHIGDLLEVYEDEPVPAEFAASVFAGVGLRRRGRLFGWGRSSASRSPLAAWYRRPMATAAAVLLAVGATVFVMRNGAEDGAIQPRAATDVVSVLKDVPADELDDLLLNADVLLAVEDAALDDVSLDASPDGDDDGEGTSGG